MSLIDSNLGLILQGSRPLQILRFLYHLERHYHLLKKSVYKILPRKPESHFTDHFLTFWIVMLKKIGCFFTQKN